MSLRDTITSRTEMWPMSSTRWIMSSWISGRYPSPRLEVTIIFSSSAECPPSAPPRSFKARVNAPAERSMITTNGIETR